MALRHSTRVRDGREDGRIEWIGWVGIQDDGRYPCNLLLTNVMHIHSLEVLVLRMSHSDVFAIALLLVTFDAVVNLSSSSWYTSCFIIRHSSHVHLPLQVPRSHASRLSRTPRLSSRYPLTMTTQFAQTLQILVVPSRIEVAEGLVVLQ